MLLSLSAQPDIKGYPIEIQPFTSLTLVYPIKTTILASTRPSTMLAGEVDLIGPGSSLFGLHYDNPLTAAAKDLRGLACVSVLVRKTPRMMRGLLYLNSMKILILSCFVYKVAGYFTGRY